VTFLIFILFAPSNLLLALFGSGLLILFISLGSAAAGDATAIPQLAAVCDRAGCVQEPESCWNNCVLLPNRAALPALSLAQQLNDNLLIDLTAPKPTNLEGASKEATNGKRPMRYMTAATDAAEPSRAETPQPHWSHLPIWGAEAEARGHRVPLPFGFGVTYYDARQPVNVRDLKLGTGSGPPQSSKFVTVGEPIISWQQNVSSRFDVWLFPFFNIYGVAGYTRGNTKGTVTITSPVFGLLNQDLPLFAEFNGPTFGGGATLGGGFRVTEWRDLHAFMVGDVNHTVTFLSFKNESLIAETKPRATVASTRVGLRGEVTEYIHASMWVGAMYQLIQEEVAGSVAGRSIEFIINQRAASPWNTLIGGQIEFGRHFNVLVEGGMGPRSSILTGAVFRF
jgi:hypothetical protein